MRAGGGVLQAQGVVSFCLYCTVLLVSAEAKAAPCTSPPGPPCHQACQLLRCPSGGPLWRSQAWLWGEPLAPAASDSDPSWPAPLLSLSGHCCLSRLQDLLPLRPGG